ncbi:MAG: acyl carrier protein [Erysipelotrichaceae bacterium]|jgi:acyl carrier protein|nr:acyl carrier protein [Bacillota bacterium]NLP21294.1 acyl carrier protein [Erysipelotrichaceae bacterium]HCY07095.1 acyl carrier protein [Erysipelotrichaceae bacterium]
MLEEIKNVLVEALNVDADEIVPEAKLSDDLDIDSLSAVELALELESTFDVTIEDEELAKLETVQDIIDIIEAKKA